jgi:hypothetical protein
MSLSERTSGLREERQFGQRFPSENPAGRIEWRGETKPEHPTDRLSISWRSRGGGYESVPHRALPQQFLKERDAFGGQSCATQLVSALAAWIHQQAGRSTACRTAGFCPHRNASTWDIIRRISCLVLGMRIFSVKNLPSRLRGMISNGDDRTCAARSRMEFQCH